MRECINALWPCAMTGAVSCLAGIRGMGTIIHGSSGCYFYPATVLHRDLHCTFLIEQDIIFGAADRLRTVISEIRGRYGSLAVVNTCTPAIIGDDITDMPGCEGVLVIDSPGFMGTYEDGYRLACESLPVTTACDRSGVNLDGISILDPFGRGNVMEAERILAIAGIPVAAVFSSCRLEDLGKAAVPTLSANPDLSGPWGEPAGSLLGIDKTLQAIAAVPDPAGDADFQALWDEAESAKERISRAADKFLRRFDPPSVAVFGQFSYAEHACRILSRYLDASITVLGSRNRLLPTTFRAAGASSLDSVRDLLSRDPPDLVIGSSFEQMISPDTAFVPFTYPLRGMVRLRDRPLIGIQGELGLMEDILNACMDQAVGRGEADRPGEHGFLV
ncbi:MAG: oxidoreductase [Methanomicrobiales archaeon]|nr:oxidoreductase [Methanomicrobiales archaeon]NYT21217.1 oxidoreductase [Methanomicrobiales archaeon]